MVVNVIEESLYRWQRQGWTVMKIENGQYTLTHADARPVICGTRTSFQTVGAVQGEMKRALQDGPKQQAVAPSPPEDDAPATPQRRPRAKRKNRVTTGETFQFDQPSPNSAINRPPFRRRAAPIDTTPVVRRSEPFENAAWELAMLVLKFKNYDDGLIEVMRRRYETDEHYRARIIHDFRNTPQEKIGNLRRQVEAKTG